MADKALNLAHLPEEILLQILTYLDAPCIAQLQLVCRSIRDVCSDNGLWRLRCLSESAFVEQHHRHVVLGAINHLDEPVVEPRLAPDTGERGSPERGDCVPIRRRLHKIRTRLYANWDYSYRAEKVSWYDEYIHRNAPAQINWFQEVQIQDDDASDLVEARGMAIFSPNSGSHDSQGRQELLAVAPLDDGSICLWDVNGTRARRGAMVARSKPGILFVDWLDADNSQRSKRIDSGVTECVSVDNYHHQAFFAVQSRLITVDLQTLSVVDSESFPFSITTLSGTTPGLPLTVGTTLGIHMHDYRARSRSPDDVIEAVDDAASQTFASLAQPGPLSILHLPAPGTEAEASNDIFVAGRFSNILHYDRRRFPSIMGSLYSGARLSSLTWMACATSPLDNELRRKGELSLSHLDRQGASNPGTTLIAGGEYNTKGSLEMYGLSLPSAGSPLQPGGFQDSAFKNRQTSSQSKLLSVVNHGTLLAFSDGSGYVKWFERDGFTEARRVKIGHSETTGQRSLFASMPASGELARKLVPTGPNNFGSNSNDLLFWTGERIGLVNFQSSPGFVAEDFEDKANSAEQAEREREERQYAEAMRLALERQADDVRFVRNLGMGSAIRG